MKVSDLFKELPVKIFGDHSVMISGICSNSKQVEKNDLFIAKSGFKHRGLDFIKEAIERGASALLLENEDKSLKNVLQIVSKDIVAIEGKIASRFYLNPSEKLKMIAITGTNGKTTTSYLIRQLIGEASCGLIGTIEYILGDKRIDATLTTPDVVSNHKMLSKMLSNHLKAAVMEATSIALTQNRLDEIDFDIALFTNFSQDHLDYHGTMENYLKAKALLFERLSKDKRALINADQKEGAFLVKNCPAMIKTYGIEKKADYRAEDIQLLPSKSLFNLVMGDKKYLVEIPLAGLYNVYNALAAISAAIEMGLDVQILMERAAKLKAPKGRFESVPNKLNAQIIVDFAHTEDALKNALLALRQLKPKRLITLFGCGGDRDPQKRPLMGKTVSNLSDITLITSDNPRSENPQKICEEVFAGCSKIKEIYIEKDRKKAIMQALKMLQKEDILLIAGRGHEKYQIIGEDKIPFEDAKITQELLQLL